MIRESIRKRFEHAPRHAKWKDVPNEQWTSWKWQLQNRVDTPKGIAELYGLGKKETDAIRKSKETFNVSITPYYAGLIKDARDPLGLQAIPQPEELEKHEEESDDPLKDELFTPVLADGKFLVPGWVKKNGINVTGEKIDQKTIERIPLGARVNALTHKYPDRVLFYTTFHCALYCRHCFRKYKVSDPSSAQSKNDFDLAIQYIKEHPQIRDVILSGGDFFSFDDEKIYEILSTLAKIDHVEMIRIGTRNLVTLPYRITDSLTKILSKYAPVYINTHFNHPAEVTLDTLEACEKLLDAGALLGNQMVLLRKVNDNVEIVRKLNHKLLMVGIKPYYIFLCDKAKGNYHLRTTLETGLEIMEKLNAWTSGHAVPQFIKDIEGGGGKIPLSPNYIENIRTDTDGKKMYTLRNYKGELFTFKDV